MRFFDAHGFRYTPSVANHLMVDARIPTPDVIAAMKQRNVYVGRPWPVWPTHVRVSIGARTWSVSRRLLEVVRPASDSAQHASGRRLELPLAASFTCAAAVLSPRHAPLSSRADAQRQQRQRGTPPRHSPAAVLPLSSPALPRCLAGHHVREAGRRRVPPCRRNPSCLAAQPAFRRRCRRQVRWRRAARARGLRRRAGTGRSRHRDRIARSASVINAVCHVRRSILGVGSRCGLQDSSCRRADPFSRAPPRFTAFDALTVHTSDTWRPIHRPRRHASPSLRDWPSVRLVPSRRPRPRRRRYRRRRSSRVPVSQDAPTSRARATASAARSTLIAHAGRSRHRSRYSRRRTLASRRPLPHGVRPNHVELNPRTSLWRRPPFRSTGVLAPAAGLRAGRRQPTTCANRDGNATSKEPVARSSPIGSAHR
jgi:hypothetical protein